jgi:hypothetical protein
MTEMKPMLAASAQVSKKPSNDPPPSPRASRGARGAAPAHCLVNRSDADAVYLEVGDRAAGDEVTYPADDLKISTDGDGRRIAAHKDGSPY